MWRDRYCARMRIQLTSVYVYDQEEARKFYTEVLDFTVKNDVPMGENRWLTVVSSQDPEGIELLLEPSGHPAVRPYRDALRNDGIPLLQLIVDDAHAEYQRLSEKGVEFVQPPVDMGPVSIAMFDDTCGNLIQIASS